MRALRTPGWLHACLPWRVQYAGSIVPAGMHVFAQLLIRLMR